jgi:N-acyl-D-aspartate/D-glutamate deacylase
MSGKHDLVIRGGQVAEGLAMRPVTAPRPIGSLFGLTGTQNPFSATLAYRSIADLPLAQRVARMREPAVGQAIVSEDPYKGSTFPLFERTGDGGAHVGYITDASFPTFLLTHWGRDRATGRQPMEDLIRHYTSDPASAVGLHDRGRIVLGRKADLNGLPLRA